MEGRATFLTEEEVMKAKNYRFCFFSKKWYSEGARAEEKAKNVNNNISNRSVRLNFINSRQSRLFTTAEVLLLRFGQISVWLKIRQTYATLLLILIRF